MQLLCTFLWGLLVLLSMLGWGGFVARWVDRERQFDAGLRASWGVAVVLLFGGVLNATQTCGYVAVIAIVLGGVILLAFRWRGWPAIDVPSVIGFLPLALILLGVYLASIAFIPTAGWNPYDDYAAYLIYPIKMLQTGAAIDPFSLRRLSTLGGPAFLEALACFPMWPRSAFLVDMGLGNIICCLLIVGLLRRRSTSALLASVPCFALLLLPLGRVNTMFIMLGIAGFLTLLHTLKLADESDTKTRRRLCCVAGTVATALVTLRPNFIPAVGLMVLVWSVLACIGRDRALGQNFLELLIIVVAAAISFAPWSIALYRSSGSFLWPLMLGNEQRRFNISTADLTAWPLIGFVFFFFLQPLIGIMVCLGLLALRGFHRAAVALWLAAIAGSAITVARFSLSDYPNLARYSLPPLAAAAVAAIVCTQLPPAGDRFRLAGRALMFLLTGVLLLQNLFAPQMFINAAQSLYRGLWLNLPLFPDNLRAEYAAAQSHIPPGKTVLCFVDYPFLLDFRRNRIFSADWPGMASPGAAIPFEEGAKPLADYLKKQRIDYLLCADFDADDPAAFCSRRYLNFRMTCPIDADGRVAVDRIYAAAALDFMDDVDAIARWASDRFSSDGLRIIPMR